MRLIKDFISDTGLLTVLYIYFNANITTGLKSPLKLLNGLTEIKQVSLSDLHSFLIQDQSSFSVLSLSAKHITSTNRLTVSLSKNSAKSFYLGDQKPKKSPGSPLYLQTYGIPQALDDCLKDAQNCSYFSLFSSKEKRLYTRFLDKVEANFEGVANQGPLLFLTLTFNTTQANYQTWTTNWNPTDLCWNTLDNKQSWLKNWAQNFDQPAEKMKILIQKVSPEVSQYTQANYYLQLFLRRIRRLWKPQQWKWTVVSELQKNGIWHFHFLSTPIVPYSHKCTLDKNFKSCWNCRTYISTLWPYGRVESRSPGHKTISSYLAKYLSKSFHLRNLYKDHGLKENHKAYRFFKNLYEYEQVQLDSPKLKNQKVFRHYDYSTGQNSYFYRTNETLIGYCLKPILIKKNYRLGISQPLNLLSLTKKQVQKEKLELTKPKQICSVDFQTHLITSLLLFCEKVQFIQLPLEQEQVPRELNQCDQNIQSHFKTKPLFHFTFNPTNVPIVLQFLEQLDNLAEQFAISESSDFYFWPKKHDSAHETLRQLNGVCGCEIKARNSYLNDWDYLTSNYTTSGPP